MKWPKLSFMDIMPRKSNPRYDHFKDLDKYDQIQIILSYALRLIMATVGVWYILLGRINFATFTFFFIILTLVPAIIQRNYKVILPGEIDFIATIFIFVTLFLGDVNGAYGRFWWYDIWLHLTGGLILGITGFLIVYLLLKYNKIEKMPASLVILFAIGFTMMVGVAWEIVEFGITELTPYVMQHGNTDTMKDLINDMIGGTTAATLGYLFLIGKYENKILKRLVRKFENKSK